MFGLSLLARSGEKSSPRSGMTCMDKFLRKRQIKAIINVSSQDGGSYKKLIVSKIKEHSRICLGKQHFSRTFPATAKSKPTPFKIIKMDTIEHGLFKQ